MNRDSVNSGYLKVFVNTSYLSNITQDLCEMDDALSDHDGSDFASQDIHTDSKGDLDVYTDPEGDLGFYTVDELHNALCNDETTSVWLPVLPVKNIESSSSSIVSNKPTVVECPDESPTEAAETLITAAEVNDKTTSVWLPVLPVKNIESSYSTVSDEPTVVECPDESPTEAAETLITAADQVFLSKEALFEGVILDVETTDDITTQPEDVGIKRKRKIVKKPEEWNRNKEKEKRLNGEPYIGFRRGVKGSTKKIIQDVPREGRVMGPACNSQQCIKWKNRECNLITNEQRKKLFHDFWRNMSWDSKKMFICSTVSLESKKQQTKIKNPESRRNLSFFYHLKIENRKVPVCREMYLKTLGIKRSELHYWLKNYGSNNVPHNKSQENQSFHNSCTESSADELSNEQVKENKSQEMDKSSTRETFQQQSYDMRLFFDELPLLPSHYCRKNSMKSYLQTDIRSWNQLYLLYTERCNREGKKPLSKFSFLRMKDEKNLAIHIPKKDKCDICCSYELKHVSEEFYKLHQLRKEAARDEKSRDKVAASEGLIHVLCSDLMMVQPLPRLRASSAYYKLKLTAHCFTVYNLLTHDSKAYWFDETQASLNATTFATCLWDYLEEILSESPKTVVLWSDGCSYQNRNSILSNALLHLSMLRNVTIIQKYLEKGHTQMECDSVHSTIERYIQHMDIHLTSQYASHTTSARKLPMPYRATVLNHKFVKDFGVSTIYSSIRPGKNKGDPTVTQLRWIQYEPNGKIKYKLNFADDLKDLPIRPRRSAPRESFPQFHPMRPSIPLDKWKDLQSLKNLLPYDTHDFYDNIPHEEESRRALKRKNQNKNDND